MRNLRALPHCPKIVTRVGRRRFFVQVLFSSITYLYKKTKWHPSETRHLWMMPCRAQQVSCQPLKKKPAMPLRPCSTILWAMGYDDEKMSNDDSMVPISWQNHPILHTNCSPEKDFCPVLLCALLCWCCSVALLDSGPYLARIVCWLFSTHQSKTVKNQFT